MCRSAVIKEFELSLEQSGKILKQVLKDYFSSSKTVNQLNFKEIFKYAAKFNLLTENKHKKILINIFHSTIHSKVDILAFSSRVNGDSVNGSDLDLVLCAEDKQPLNIDELMQFKEGLRQSNISFLVHVLDWNRIPDTFKENIRKQYEILK